MADEDLSSGELFRINPKARAHIQIIGRQIPVLLIEDVFDRPEALRNRALELDYHPPNYPYPGKLGDHDQDEPSLRTFLTTVLSMVNREYIPRIPPISENGRRIAQFSRVLSDFAITDVHPDDLSDEQRKPHVDPVPIFGLIYLNPVERGGTLFFNRTGDEPDGNHAGYFVEGSEEYAPVGKIEGLFNRLAVYPGFVPHTGEIVGDWIKGDERFTTPRLTQRLVFFP